MDITITITITNISESFNGFDYMSTMPQCLATVAHMRQQCPNSAAVTYYEERGNTVPGSRAASSQRTVDDRTTGSIWQLILRPVLNQYLDQYNETQIFASNEHSLPHQQDHVREALPNQNG